MPDLLWARLRVYEDGGADVVSCGARYGFDNEEEALHWLAEDEFIPLSDLDEPLCQEYGLRLDGVRPPIWTD